MRPSAWLAVGLSLVTGTALALEGRQIKQAALTGLPQCPESCLDDIFQQYGCSIENKDCLCGTGEATMATETCTTSNCTLNESLDLQYALEDAMFAFATFFTLCRFVSRSPLFGGTGYGWDDWTLLFCYMLLVPTDMSAEIEVQNGLGLDVFMVPTPNIVEILRWFYIGEILYNIIVMVTKISILLLYLRIWTADSTTHRFRTICWILIALLAATTLTGIFTIIFQCSPVSYAWLQATGTIDGTCIQLTPFTYVYAALDILFDFVIFLLPITNLLILTVPLWKKLGVLLVFLCGFFVTACSIIRLQYLVRLGDTTNLTWDFQYIGMWSLVECNFSVVCVCMPAMAGLVQRVWSGTFRVRTVVVTKGGRARLVEEIEGNLRRGGSGDRVEKGVRYVESGKGVNGRALQ